MNTTNSIHALLARTGHRIFRQARGFTWPTLLVWLLGFALGALTDIYPEPSFVVAGVLTLLILLLIVANAVRAEWPGELGGQESAVLAPDVHAAAAVAQAGEVLPVIGQAIEILPHPNLNMRAAIEELGWDPADVSLNDLQQEFDARALLAKVGGLQDFEPPNGVKFCLSDISFVTSDSPVLTLDLQRTDYFTIKSVLPLLKGQPELRREFGHLDPANNGIPHSVCLHYIVRFCDGRVLCMKRDPRAAYHGGLWSFSGEEQLSEVDFSSEYSTQSLFCRTFCEEVLPLRDESPLAERWEIASPMVKAMRLWSVFVEEGIFNFSLAGVYQLGIDAIEFARLYTELVTSQTGSRDVEGSFFVVTQEMLKSLLFSGECTARTLFGDRTQQVKSEDLHPTSLYRVSRLVRAAYRRPLKAGM